MKRLMRLLSAVATLAAFVAIPTPASAATLLVDDDGAQCPGAPHATIQAAVNAAGPGDTIQVCAGTYPEPAPGPLTINKTLTLEGAQSGVDARSPRALESIVTDPQGTSVSASDVTIDGFTVQDSIVSAFTGYGIWMNPGTTGTRIQNNIIQNNIVGIGLANTGASQVLIRHNLIQNNNMPGGARGTGIYTDEFVAGGAAANFLIEENRFVGNMDAGVDVSHTMFSVSNLDVSNNEFDMNGRAMFLINTDTSSFHDNSVSNSTFASADVRIYGGVDDFTILRNDLSQGPGHGIRLSGFVGGPNSGVEIHQNNIEVYAMTGLTVDPLSHTGTVDAECNWWDSSTGPVNPGNPGGTGEEVVGDADFTPWLIARAPNGPCVGIASTPGKVTGGGQVTGDPVFSPLGALLSPPALVPSLAGGSSQATFGFVVKCCPATGNLEYNDHQMGVRIKAQSMAALSIENGSCGPNTHATITGTAAVIRSTGTTTESFTVEVDDCGEPGTLDTFGIETTTYSRPSSNLIGGNIQIHRQ